jgi:hypothetical protein
VLKKILLDCLYIKHIKKTLNVKRFAVQKNSKYCIFITYVELAIAALTKKSFKQVGSGQRIKMTLSKDDN